MNSAFGALDWVVFCGYFWILIILSIIFSRAKVETTRDYFVGGNSMPNYDKEVKIKSLNNPMELIDRVILIFKI
ncbi:MAG: hypothetical protein QM493_02665 [Sulfurovum sp.]